MSAELVALFDIFRETGFVVVVEKDASRVDSNAFSLNNVVERELEGHDTECMKDVTLAPVGKETEWQLDSVFSDEHAVDDFLEGVVVTSNANEVVITEVLHVLNQFVRVHGIAFARVGIVVHSSLVESLFYIGHDVAPASSVWVVDEADSLLSELNLASSDELKLCQVFLLLLLVSLLILEQVLIHWWSLRCFWIDLSVFAFDLFRLVWSVPLKQCVVIAVDQ